LQAVKENPAFQRMLKYAFVGDKETVKAQTEKFFEETGVDEVIVASHIYDHEDRLRSFKIFSEVMNEI